MAEFIESFEELDRLEVLVAAVDVGDPLPGFARVVEIDHRGHGVDSQSVDVVTIKPEKQAFPQQEVADLGPAKVEDLGTPQSRCSPSFGVGMLVEMRPVKK